MSRSWSWPFINLCLLGRYTFTENLKSIQHFVGKKIITILNQTDRQNKTNQTEVSKRIVLRQSHWRKIKRSMVVNWSKWFGDIHLLNILKQTGELYIGHVISDGIISDVTLYISGTGEALKELSKVVNMSVNWRPCLLCLFSSCFPKYDEVWLW